MHNFHAIVQDWFLQTYNTPTEVQRQAWISCAHHANTLIAAPTGSGKTFAAFLHSIDQMIRKAEQGQLEQRIHVIYVSPLKALSNDIEKNLRAPLEALNTKLQTTDPDITPITAAVRTGDTPANIRTRMLRSPPHILVTTPESLYILLTSDSGRNLLEHTETLIIDEIHALIDNKRGAHLSLSIERLAKLCGKPLNRIGLSATQNPITHVAEFLKGNTQNATPCHIINVGHTRKRDLDILLPDTALEAVMSNEVWNEIYQQLELLVKAHRTTLIFVNTRRLCERIAKALTERLGEDNVSAHHGSLATEHRLDAETRLKSGQLSVLVATASLELGIDIGDIDLVCQIGSPRAINTFIQRVGRAGHQVDGIAKGRIFPLTRDELIECTALLQAIRDGQLDRNLMYPAPLDVLAQQIVAEIACGEQSLETIYHWVTASAVYHALEPHHIDAVITMLADGYHTRRGRRSAYLHLDRVNRTVRPRKGARLTAITNGGAIPDHFDFEVVLLPDTIRIGTLNEDFAIESMAGDIFQLGNQSYQIARVDNNTVYVYDAHGQPPNLPFWLGEALGRSDILSLWCSQLRIFFLHAIEQHPDQAQELLSNHYQLSESAASQIHEYLAASYYALGTLPHQNNIVYERFFDDAEDQHLVIHSCFGSRVNKAWGLALRKRFCRKFNFELQAAALEDTIILSLGATHSFALEDVARYLNPNTIHHTVTQALLDIPLFATHWRWNATIALAVRRFSGGKRTPPQFQRSDAEDLIAVVFPDQIACLENIAGEREIPDHPLVQQTLYDCLNQLMDVDRLQDILEQCRESKIQQTFADLNTPSPIAAEIINAKPYAFLDEAPLEERRTQMVRTTNFLNPEDFAVSGRISIQSIETVTAMAWPTVTTVDQCHDALMMLGITTHQEADDNHWIEHIKTLQQQERCFSLKYKTQTYYLATEHKAISDHLYPEAKITPAVTLPNLCTHYATIKEALTALVRMRLQTAGPTKESTLAALLHINPSAIHQACLTLEHEGMIMQGKFTEQTKHDQSDIEWCERGLLARMRKLTLSQKRKQIEPISLSGFIRFLTEWQGITKHEKIESDDPTTLITILEQLEGFEIHAPIWEHYILPARLRHFQTYWLDIITANGNFCWIASNNNNTQHAKLHKQSRVALLPYSTQQHWGPYLHTGDVSTLSDKAKDIFNLLTHHGAQFLHDIKQHLRGLTTEHENALSELAANGLITSDSFNGLRALINTTAPKKRNYRGRSMHAIDQSGRWSAIASNETSDKNKNLEDWRHIEHIAQVLLRRYGVIFRALIDHNETLLPSWRDLLYVLRRMEARDEVRGGRFIKVFSGEQFALPEILPLLKKAQKHTSDESILIHACDPLNLTGQPFSAKRIAANNNNYLLLQNGEYIAALVNKEIVWLKDKKKFSLQQQNDISQQLKVRPKNGIGRYRHKQSPPPSIASL